MRTRPELLLLQKTMVVVEGVARTLDPKLDMWTVAEPVVREWIERNLGPAGRIEDAAQGAGEVGRFLGRRAGPAGRAAPRSPSRSTPPPATASCWRPRPSPRSAGPRRGATAARRGAVGDRRAAGDRHVASCVSCCMAAGMIALIAMQSLASHAASGGPWPASPSASSTTQLKEQLRLRAARHGRSMEEEVRPSSQPRGGGSRHVDAARCGRASAARQPARARRCAARNARRQRRVLLIIGGGIAAYKSLDLIRRLRERGIAVRVRHDQGGAGIRHAAVGRRARRRARLHRPVRRHGPSSMSAISGSRARPTSSSSRRRPPT